MTKQSNLIIAISASHRSSYHTCMLQDHQPLVNSHFTPNGCIRSDLQTRDLPASVEQGVQRLAAGKQSAAAVVVAVAAVVGDHYSPSGLLYALEDASTCTFLYDTVPKNSNKIACEPFIV